ncbi:hypothetical protein SpCBS45565_g01221 [Spizellomyces sp. 'palustris']|nr:hypothetical protein SpCBS45565_g01221 [Spizellomyces sp. 'palustris']
MGKSANNKKKSARKYRTDPTGLSGPPVVLSSSSTQQQEQAPEVLPIVKKLASFSPEDRAWAATALSNLVLDQDTRKKLLSGGLVDALLRLLSDAQVEVALEGAGALRNLAVVGGEDVCREMFKKNVLTPLLALTPKLSEWIAKVLSGEPTTDKTEQTQRRVTFDFAEQIVALLWSLSENLDDAVKTITTSPIIPFLMDIINPAHNIPWSLVQVAAQCLNTLTEDNIPCHNYFTSHPEYTTLLASIASGTVQAYTVWDENRILLRALSAGILYNVRSTVPEEQQHQLYVAMVSGVTSTLDYDIPDAIQTAANVAKVMSETPMPDMKDGEEMDVSKMNEKENIKLQSIGSNLETLQLSLEILSNIFSDDMPNSDAWEDASQTSNDDEVDEAITMMENDTDIHDSGMDIEPSNDPRLPILQSHPTLLATLLRLSIPQQAPNLTHLQNLQNRALTALTNILSTSAGQKALMATPNPEQLWVELFTIAQQSNGETLEACVGALWALARCLEGTGKIVPTVEQMDKLCEGAKQGDEGVQSKCVGVLGVLAKVQGNVEMNRRIGHTLVNHLPTAPVAVAIEILNALFDIYADASYDYDLPVFGEGGFLKTLTELIPVLRTRAKAVDKRRFRHVREAADLAIVNLRAFVEYKRSERA